MPPRLSHALLLASLALHASLALSCAGGEGGTSDTGQPDADTGGDGEADAPDGGLDADATPDLPGNARWVKPEGAASLVFRVDDSANATYGDAEMEWNGSFVYDAATNLVTFSSSWLPDQGPFPPLYDDGPYTAGGHEASGATAGDHVFEVEVFFVAEETTTFEYGLINEVDNWIWLGPNGQITVNAGETGTVTAAGLTFPRFGTIDMRVVLDTSALHSEFATVDPANDAIYLKGSMISWRPTQLLDNGERGDATAGDGLFTFTLSEYLGAHDGLLSLGQEAQFVFVFFDALGTEYKLGGNALTNGVSAESTWNGSWQPEELLLRSESAGQALNTAIVVGPDDNPSEDPILRFVDPDRGPTTGGTPVELSGEFFAPGVTVTFGSTEASCVVQSDRIIDCTTPARATAGVVGVTVTNPDGGTDTHLLGFTYLDAASTPRVDSVTPSEGSEVGGTSVTIAGANFQSGASVAFGDELATEVSVTVPGSITATTPGGLPGPVDVTVRNPDGQTGTLSAGFNYRLEGIDWAGLQWPTTTITVGLDQPLPPLYAVVYEPGVTDAEGQGGGITAEIVVGPAGTDPSDDFAGWSTYATTFNDDSGNNDEYTQDEDITFGEAGEYEWAARFSLDGGSTWYWADFESDAAAYDPASSGSIVVTSGMRVDSVEPHALSLFGSAQLVVVGANFSASTTAMNRPFGAGAEAFASVPVTFDSATQLTLDFPTPAGQRQVGRWDLRFEDGDDVLVLENAYLVGYVWSPTVDGTIDDAFPDWDPAFRHAENTVDTSWTGNGLYAMYASFDEDGLYLGVSADLQRDGTESDPGNVLVVYVDTDFGAGSGFTDMAAIADEDTDQPASYWRLDRALTSQIDAGDVAGFGADFAFGSFDLAPTAAEDYIDALTGWRQLRIGDNAWYPIDHACEGGVCVAGTAGDEETAGAIETFVPWTVLYGDGGVPLGGRRVALFARILNKTGDFISNQSLPEEPDDEDPWNVTQVVVFDVR